MCGIAGIACAAGLTDGGLLERMRDAMAHRGPDDAGAWWSAGRCVGLGHRRLAILDLSPAGHQPMADARGRCHIVFNGEIYNFQEVRGDLEGLGHAFRSSSDTEVILAAYRQWGEDCLRRLEGMFAFALYDPDRRLLLLARDRAGEKPLFYSLRQGVFRFASELKGLFADPSFPRQLDLESLDYYLAYGYVPFDRCLVRHVSKLPQGHALSFALDTGACRTWRYWDLPAEPVAPLTDAEEASRELERELQRSVQQQLVADVPVGILLSGGVDSSLITALAAHGAARRVRTFTVTFPDSAGYDESPYARLVARHFGTEHTELEADRVSLEVLPTLARQFDEPVADQAIVPLYLLSRLVRQHVTVALGGDGGDELFGGYTHYGWVLRGRTLRRLFPGPLRAAAAEAASRWLPLGARARNHVIGLRGDTRYSVAHVNMYFDAASRRRLVARPWAERVRGASPTPEAFKCSLTAPGASLVRQATEVDFRSTLVDAYLVKVDRAAMASSLEVRAPFLAPGVIELAYGRLADGLRVTPAQRKIVPRQLARRLLPPALDTARKQGFAIPLSQWFHGEWGRYFAAVLRRGCSGLFDPGFIEGLLRRQESGYSNMHRLFGLVLFELWFEEYGIGV
ncbi:MAG: asparagine synthase (glutamine-hydrolyzing) [Candidatus Latescibacterota bacterium]